MEIILFKKSEVRKMVKKKYIAPNLITAGNMFLGYLSITESIKNSYLKFYFIYIFFIF